MIGVHALLIEVALRADVVGDAPRQGRRAADHDGGNAHIRGPRDPCVARVDPGLIPARDRFERDVRIARDHRFARPRVLARHDPVVAAARIATAQRSSHTLRLADAASTRSVHRVPSVHRFRRVAPAGFSGQSPIGLGRNDRFVVGLARAELVVQRTFTQRPFGKLGLANHGKPPGQIPLELDFNRDAVERSPGRRLIVEQIEFDR